MRSSAVWFRTNRSRSSLPQAGHGHQTTVVVNEDVPGRAIAVGQPRRSRRGTVRGLRPLVVGGGTGVLAQNLDHEHAFDDADARLLTTLAGSLSVALENARLFEESRQRNAELALINTVQGGLAENLELTS
jgi:GAF domain-containing protein